MTSTDTVFAGSIPAFYDRLLGPMLFEPYAAEVAGRARRWAPKDILETAAGTGIVAPRGGQFVRGRNNAQDPPV